MIATYLFTWSYLHDHIYMIIFTGPPSFPQCEIEALIMHVCVQNNFNSGICGCTFWYWSAKVKVWSAKVQFVLFYHFTLVGRQKSGRQKSNLHLTWSAKDWISKRQTGDCKIGKGLDGQKADRWKGGWYDVGRLMSVGKGLVGDRPYTLLVNPKDDVARSDGGVKSSFYCDYLCTTDFACGVTLTSPQ